jgi:two-component system sensor histidine kinase AlgZ
MAPFMETRGVSWSSALLANTVATLGIGLAVANGFRFLVPLLQRRLPGRVASVAIHVLVGLGATVVGVEVAVRAMGALGGMDATHLRPHVLRVGLVVVAIAVAIDLGYERLRQRARRDEMRAEQARKEALRAQLKALQARTNPHFLFNSLNTVAGLIEDDPVAAERVLERLGDIFRYALQGAEGGWVRLGDELTAVCGYLEVEAMRLGDRLRSEVDLAPELREILVPPLVLQPLVENAVLHAIAPRKGGGQVRVTGQLHNGALRLTVEDDGPGPGTSAHRGSGTSLAELRQRLEMLYGGEASLETGHGEAGGFIVRVTLPAEAPA